MTLTLTGEHIGATLAMDAAALTDNGDTALDDQLAPSASFTVDGPAYAPITTPGTHTVQATVSVDLRRCCRDQRLAERRRGPRRDQRDRDADALLSGPGLKEAR